MQLLALKAPLECGHFEELGTITPDETGCKSGEPYEEDTNLLFTYTECYVRR